MCRSRTCRSPASAIDDAPALGRRARGHPRRPGGRAGRRGARDPRRDAATRPRAAAHDHGHRPGLRRRRAARRRRVERGVRRRRCGGSRSRSPATRERSSLEIFHVSHGKYETHSPMRTFVPYDGGASILAAYTCTPVVHFSLADAGRGRARRTGRTVAELGAMNTPLDMVVVRPRRRGVPARLQQPPSLAEAASARTSTRRRR